MRATPTAPLFLTVLEDAKSNGKAASIRLPCHLGSAQRLSAAGIGGDGLERIRGPIGLDIGARGAPEIAISIMAEVTSALRQGAGGAK